MQLVKNAQQQGLRCIIDSSGDALAAALDVGNIELVKPNQKSLAPSCSAISANPMTCALPLSR